VRKIKMLWQEFKIKRFIRKINKQMDKLLKERR
jgi:hypothetical protein